MSSAVLCHVVLALSSEVDPCASEVLAKRFPDLVQLGAIEAVTHHDLQQVMEGVRASAFLLTGAVSSPDISAPGPAKSQGSRLLQQFRRILEVCQVVCTDRRLEFVWLLETVASIGTSGARRVSTQLASSDVATWKPLRLNAAELGWVRRDRLFWCNRDLAIPLRGLLMPCLSNVAVELTLPEFDRGLPALTSLFKGQFQPEYLAEAATSRYKEGRFLTFTRPLAMLTAGRTASEAALQRQQAHGWYDSSQYEAPNLLWHRTVGTWQTLSAEHREALLGLPRGHTHAGPLKGLERERCAVLARSSHVPSLALLLLCLLHAVSGSAIAPPPSLCDTVDPDVAAYCAKLPSPMLQVVGPFRSLLAGPSHHLHTFWHECRRRGKQFDPAPDLREHDLRGLGAVAAGQQRGGETHKHGLPRLIPWGFSATEHVQEALSHVGTCGHPYASGPLLACDTSFAIDFAAAQGSNLPTWRRQVLRELVAVAKSLEPLSTALRKLMSERVARVAGKFHLGFLLWLQCVLGWPDVNFTWRLIVGFDIVGDVEVSNVLRMTEPSHTTESVDGLLGSSAAFVTSLCESMRPHHIEEWDDELLRLTQKDIDRGSGEGFFTRQAMDARFGVNSWRPLPRYVIKQEHNNKFRAIDNGRAAGHNGATTTRERVHTTSLEFFASASKQFLLRKPVLEQQAANCNMCLKLEVGVDDEEDAYRKYPTADSQQHWSVVALFHRRWGTVAFMPLVGHAFGLKSSVNNYNRAPGLLVAVLTRILAVCNTHFYDDFAVVDTNLGKGTARACLRDVGGLIGTTFGETKGQAMNTVVTYIGCQLDTSRVFSHGELGIDCKEGRRETLIAMVESIQQKGVLDPALAGKLRAKACYAGSTLTGRCLRGCENALVAVQYGALPPQIASPVSESLQFLLLAMRLLPGRTINLTPNPADCVVVYTDAMWEEGQPAGMAFVAFCVKWSRPKCAYLCVPDDYLRVLLPRETQINQAEVLAAVLVPQALGSLLQGCDVLHFVDNQGALAALIKGYSPQEDCSALCAMIHLLHARTQTRCYYEHVESSANISDAMSRHGVRAALPSWEVLKVSLPPARRLPDLTLGTLLAAFGHDPSS